MKMKMLNKVLTFLSATCAALLCSLYWSVRQKSHYIALIAGCVATQKLLIGAAMAYTLQNHGIIQTQNLRTAAQAFETEKQMRYSLSIACHSPNVVIHTLATFNEVLNEAQALLFLGWAVFLLASVWTFNSTWYKDSKIANRTKASCFIISIINTVVIQIPHIYTNDTALLLMSKLIRKVAAFHD